MIKKNSFKKGAASFYVVAIATLILMIVATSFAAVIISEIARTSNDDLAQSAYDSALAGVEDAKLAYYSYLTCKEGGAGAVAPNGDNEITCGEIVWYLENSGSDCSMVGRILGRIPVDEDREVVIRETEDGNNNMQQAYTCTKVKVRLKNYITRLSGDNSSKVIKVRLDDGVNAEDIKSIRVSWRPAIDEDEYSYTNVKDGKVVFPDLETQLASPPTLEIGLIQTANEFRLGDFEMTKIESGESVTDRGTLYLVPTDDSGYASSRVAGNHESGYDASRGMNYISKEGFSKSNDKTASNLPYAVYCSPDSLEDFICSTTIELPNPVGGTRNDDTFLIVPTVPYGAPDTEISLEFCMNEGGCVIAAPEEEEEEEEIDTRAILKGMQISIDSTGRANDLYRRVEMILETEDESYEYTKRVAQLFKKDFSSGFLINKDFSDDPVVTEYNF